MPGLDRELDPVAGDYVPNGKGGTKTTRSAATAVVHQFRLSHNTWPGDPDAGIRNQILDRAKSSPPTAVAIEDMTRDALQPLVDLDWITVPRVVVERQPAGRVAHEVVAVDRQTGEELRLTKLATFNP